MRPAEHADAGPRVLATRSPERAGELVELLRARGATVALCPLHEPARISEDRAGSVLEIVTGPDSPRIDAVTFSSVNAVRGLADVVARRDLDLPRVLGSSRIHCVGEATARAAREAGLTPEALPEEASAVGMVRAWPSRAAGPDRDGGSEGRRGTTPGRADRTPETVLCVHGDPSRPDLPDGLRGLGLRVVETVVYRMADYPASDPLVDPASITEPCVPVLTGAQAASKLAEGRWDVVVATSPNLLAALADLGPLPEPVVCIGGTTADRARELGLRPAVARSPRPQDVADAALAPWPRRPLETNPTTRKG